ncbi:hypothetical protein Patl1_15005 [Pistacia atlantica]|uniref:Uncharacterized protein n=1 Tax=Pistacia atlantica TaxID=434234 RepID=A0ACC1B7P1_9ROSI|nr:hypothetical protein Patl1_15005 [Pistacia atlantica]
MEIGVVVGMELMGSTITGAFGVAAIAFLRAFGIHKPDWLIAFREGKGDLASDSRNRLFLGGVQEEASQFGKLEIHQGLKASLGKESSSNPVREFQHSRRKEGGGGRLERSLKMMFPTRFQG